MHRMDRPPPPPPTTTFGSFRKQMCARDVDDLKATGAPGKREGGDHHHRVGDGVGVGVLALVNQFMRS